MAGQGGTIYRDGKVRTETAQSGYSTSQLANNVFDNSSQIEGEARQEKAEAFSIYSNNMKALATENMGKAFQSYGNDPVRLGEELSKLKADMVKTMPDPKLKSAFMADYELQSSSYVNQAQANFEKIQYEKKKSSIFNSLMNNDNAISLSLSNSLRGTANGDDYVNFKRSMQQNKSMINTLNPDGTYMFSDSKRLTMSKNLDKQVSDSLERSYMEMPDYQRKQFMKNIENDNVTLMQIDNATGSHKIMLQDTVDPEMYRDMKRKIQDIDLKERKRIVSEFNVLRSEAKMNYLKKPTEVGLSELKAMFPEMTTSEKEKYENVLAPDNEDAVTAYEDYKLAISDLQALAKDEIRNEKERNELMQKATNITLNARLGNIRGNFDIKDLNEVGEAAQKLITDTVFKRQVENMPSISIFDKIGDRFSKAGEAIDRTSIFTGKMSKDASFGEFTSQLKKDVLEVGQPLVGIKRDNVDKKQIQKIGMETANAYLMVARAGGKAKIFSTGEITGVDDTREGKIVTSQEVFDMGVQRAIKYKYKDIPDLQKDLEPEKSYVNYNGKVYKFKGWSATDALIEEMR